jgi:hypothetical protein
MDTDSTSCSEGISAPEPSPRFEIVLAYQDLPTGLHARQFLNHVLDHCQLASNFNLTLWKLELFHLPELREEAVRGACQAALVVLSLRGDIGVEANTANWLAQWMKQRSGEESALAVLIDCDMQRMDSIGQTLFQLQEITQQSQVRLFVGFMPSVPPPYLSTAKPESENTETMIAVRNPVVPPSKVKREGGINE